MDTYYLAWIGNGAALTAIAMSFIGLLPPLAAAAAIIWYAIQIWESRTVQDWWRARQVRRKAEKIARLQARQRVIVAELDALEVKRAAATRAAEVVRQAEVHAAEKVESAKAAAKVEVVATETKAAVEQIKAK